MWFIGDVGTGKTTLAMLISKTAMDANRTVAIYSLPRLLAMLRETFGEGARYSLVDLVDRLCSVDLLHIDDVGAEQSSSWVMEQLYTIVNTRYEDQRSMVVTTNLVTDAPRKVFDDKTGEPEIDPDTGQQREHHPDHELRRQVGDRTVSRLYEMCGMPLPLFGDDLRSFVKFDPPGGERQSRDTRRVNAANAIDRWDDAVDEELSSYGRPLPGRDLGWRD